MEYVPVGRFDVYMYPFYKRDLDKGEITPEQAQELIDCFWLRANDRAQLKPGLVENQFDPAFMQLGGAFDIELEPQVLTMAWQQNVILAGKHADGSDATNEITYMALESTRRFSLANPVVTVRLSNQSPEHLIRKCAECLQGGGGYPFIHNDDVIIEALMKLGIPREDANVYGNDGCWECTIPGKTEFRYSNIEALLCLELAMSRGRRRITGQVDGPDTGDPAHFKTFEGVYEAFTEQMSKKADGFVENIMTYYGSVYDIAPDPFMSSLLDDCVKEAKDLTEGGARYILHAPLLAGLADAANSLAAIRKVVFEDKALTMAELIALLESNFEGREDIRQMLINRVPKYGNDDDYVDDIVLRILNTYTTLIDERAKKQDWILFPCGAGTFERYILLGKHVGATPDGRKSADWIAANCNPSVGSDREGLSSLINSFAKIDFTKLPAGSPLNVRVSGKFVKGEKGQENLVSLVKAFLRLKGNMLTVIVHDAETLRKAQKEPEKHRGLKVTIGGYQVYFTLLTPEHQEYHITRTEHGLT
jgi:formate C-acetyltransferase